MQNHYDAPKANAWKSQDHLKGYGLDWPSGTRIKLDGGVKLKRILPQTDKVPSAQPRFAVAMDFFDLLEERVFLKFESEVEDGPFRVVINENLPEVNFIDQLTLVARAGSKWVEFETVITEKGPRVLTVQAPIHEDQFQKKVMSKKNPLLFLRVTFNTVLSETTGYTQYNFNSPWLIRVSIKKNKPKFLELAGFSIERHGKHGEIPNFKWYRKNFKNLYPYNRELPKSDSTDD